MMLLATFITAVVLSAMGTWLVRFCAGRWSLIDKPNERSSHARAVPRGGGIAIVLVVLLSIVIALAANLIDTRQGVSVSCAALAIAFVGLVDDRRSVSPWVRLGVQLAGALTVIAAQSVGHSPISVLQVTLATLWLVGSTNVYNFMDGTDGLAAMQAIFLSIALFLISRIGGLTVSNDFVLISACGACVGFLLFNWPPASIFLGDVGSGFLGFMFAYWALLAVASGLSTAVIVIVFGSFLADASVTLARRVWRGERWYLAHRSHAYQRLSRRWRSHRRVLLLYASVNAFWLMPLACLATMRSGLGTPLALVALVPLFAAAVFLGAGKPDAE